MMNAMMMMPSSSCSPEEREKRKKVKHQIASLKKRQKHTEDMSTGTLLSLVAFNNHPTRGGERGGLLQNSSSSSSFSASLARKSTRCSSKKLASSRTYYPLVRRNVVIGCASSSSSSSKNSQSTRVLPQQKRSHNQRTTKRGEMNTCQMGKKRRRIPERIRPGTDGRREEEKRGTRKSGRISSHGRVPGTFEKQQRRGVQRERHGEKQRVRGPLERNRDVNHSGYRRERKLGQSRQSRLRATESAVTLQLPTLVPEDAKVPDGMGRAAVRRPVRGPARFRYDFGRRVRHGNGPGELSVFEERPSRRSWRLI